MIRTIINAVTSGMPAGYIFALVASLVVVFMFSLPVHEWAHAYTAYRLGDNTARFRGRMTINPFAHFNLWGTLLLVFLGFGYAEPVPVNPLNFKNRKRGMALTSLMGPISNFVQAYVFMLLGKIVLFYGNSIYFAYFFQLVAMMNAGLMVFNLLPIPPLDGSRIFSLFLSEKTYFKVMQYERYIMLVLMLAVFSGLLDAPIRFLQNGILSILDFLTGFIGIAGTSAII